MLKIDVHKILGKGANQFEVQLQGVFRQNEITALHGPSGSGKSTILRLIAGLDHPTAGNISFSDKKWFDNGVICPLKKRPVGIVFQDHNLFRNMSVERNLAFASDGEVTDEVKSFAEQMKITEVFDRYPHQLSKGQQQKVAILRCLSQKNEVLLMDEPFSALDDESILDLIHMIDQIREQTEMVIIIVSHRKDVILKMADSVVMMETAEQGNPKDLIHRLL